MRQTIKARFHDGVLQPLEPLILTEESEVQVTVDSVPTSSGEDILQRAARVYNGLSQEQVSQIEAVTLDRRQFFREPAA